MDISVNFRILHGNFAFIIGLLDLCIYGKTENYVALSLSNHAQALSFSNHAQALSLSNESLSELKIVTKLSIGHFTSLICPYV